MELLRSTLQPLTRSLPIPLQNALISLLGAHCHKTLLLDITLDPTCLKLALSKSLGLGIVAVSSVVKVPQLLKLLNSQSSAGLSFTSVALETTSYLIALSYNVRKGFPFSTYGETACLAVQDVVIAAAVLWFGGRQAAAGMWVAAVAIVVGALFTEGLLGEDVLSRLMAGAGVLGVVSKAPQIWTIWQEGGTGQLSAFAVFNYLAGSLTRIFTTLQEVDDKLVLYGFVAGFVLNAVLAAQMVYYWNSPQTANHATEMGKEPEKIAMGSSTSAQASSKSPTTRRRG